MAAVIEYSNESSFQPRGIIEKFDIDCAPTVHVEERDLLTMSFFSEDGDNLLFGKFAIRLSDYIDDEDVFEDVYDGQFAVEPEWL